MTIDLPNSERVTVDCKFVAAGEPGTIEGLASVFYNVDSGRDIILPGAFRESLAAHRTRGSMPAMLLQHDPNRVIGRWTSITQNARGLAVTGKLSLGTKDADETYVLVRDGAISGLSIGYTIPPGGATTRAGVRTLHRVELHEISLTAVPMNSEARVTSVKSVARPTSIREFERRARDALGLTRSEGKVLASIGWPLIGRRDAPDAALEGLAADLRAKAASIRKASQ